MISRTGQACCVQKPPLMPDTRQAQVLTNPFAKRQGATGALGDKTHPNTGLRGFQATGRRGSLGDACGPRQGPLAPDAPKAQVGVDCRAPVQAFVQVAGKLATTLCVINRCASVVSASTTQSVPPGRSHAEGWERGLLDGFDERPPPGGSNSLRGTDLRRWGCPNMQAAKQRGPRPAALLPAVGSREVPRERDDLKRHDPGRDGFPGAMRAKRNPVLQRGHAAQVPVPIRFTALTLDGRSPHISRPARLYPRSENSPFPVRCLFIEKRFQRC